MWLTRQDRENKLLREVEFNPNLALDGTVSRLIDEEADISSSRTIPLEIPTYSEHSGKKQQTIQLEMHMQSKHSAKNKCILSLCRLLKKINNYWLSNQCNSSIFLHKIWFSLAGYLQCKYLTKYTWSVTRLDLVHRLNNYRANSLFHLQSL